MTHLASNDDFVFLGYDVNEVKIPSIVIGGLGSMTLRRSLFFPEAVTGSNLLLNML